MGDISGGFGADTSFFPGEKTREQTTRDVRRGSRAAPRLSGSLVLPGISLPPPAIPPLHSGENPAYSSPPLHKRRRGGIGRRDGLKIRFGSPQVSVRPRPPVPSKCLIIRGLQEEFSSFAPRSLRRNIFSFPYRFHWKGSKIVHKLSTDLSRGGRYRALSFSSRHNPPQRFLESTEIMASLLKSAVRPEVPREASIRMPFFAGSVYSR